MTIKFKFNFMSVVELVELNEMGFENLNVKPLKDHIYYKDDDLNPSDITQKSV